MPPIGRADRRRKDARPVRHVTAHYQDFVILLRQGQLLLFDTDFHRDVRRKTHIVVLSSVTLGEFALVHPEVGAPWRRRPRR